MHNKHTTHDKNAHKESYEEIYKKFYDIDGKGITLSLLKITEKRKKWLKL